MNTLTQKARKTTPKKLNRENGKPSAGVGIGDNVFEDLFSMVEEIFGPEQKQSRRSRP